MDNIPNVNHAVTENDLLMAPHVFPEGTAAGDVVTMTNDGLAEIGYTLHLVTETDLDLQDQGYEIGQYIEIPLTGQVAVAENYVPQSGADVVSAASANPPAMIQGVVTPATLVGETPIVDSVEDAPVLTTDAPAMTTFDKPTFYRGMEIMGQVEDVDHQGTPMKRFTTTDKSNYFVSAADFNSNLE